MSGWKTGARAALLAALLALAGCGQEDPQKLLTSARDYLTKNEYRAASIQLKNALQIDGQLAEARFLLGTTFLRQGDGVSAELELRKALAAGYPAEQVQPELARALLQQGKNQEVINQFGNAAMASPAAQVALKTMVATAQAALGEAARAQATVDAALAILPDDPDARFMQARLQATRGDIDAALASLDRILAATPTHREALAFRGDLLLYGKRQSEAALAAYRRSIESNPSFQPGYSGALTILLADNKLDDAQALLAQLKKKLPNTGETRYFEAQLAYQKKDYATAREGLQQLLKLAPDNPRFLQLAGAIEYQTGSFVQAAFYLNRALQRSPNQEFARRMLVATYLASRQPRRALEALPGNVDQPSADAELLTLAGQAYLQSGDAKKAESLFARASKLDPTSVAKRTSLAIAQLQGGKTELALGELREIASTDTGPLADQQLIAIHLGRGEHDKALAAIDRLEKKLPGSPLPAQLRGVVYLSLRDIAAARRYFEQALATDPAFLGAAAELARLDLQDGQFDAARARFDSVLKREPKNLSALLALADIKARSGGTPEEVAALLDNAVRANPTELAPRRALIEHHLRTGNPRLALAAAQSALADIAQSPELLEALGRAQQAAGELNQALATFNKLAVLQPAAPLPQLRIGAVHLQEKRPDAARQAWQQALQIQPDYLDAQRGLLGLDLRDGKLPAALELVRKVQAQRPAAPIGWVLEGDIHATRGQWGEAITAYRSALKNAPDDTALAIKLNLALTTGGRNNDAATFAQGWLAAHPNDDAFQAHLGNIALFRKDFAAAEQRFRTAVQHSPHTAWVLNNLAWALLEQKKPDSVAFAQDAVRLAPAQPAFLDTLALALSSTGDHAKAVETQQKAIALKPDNPTFKLHLAKIYLAANDRKNARIELDGLAALGDKFPQQPEVSKLLASL